MVDALGPIQPQTIQPQLQSNQGAPQSVMQQPNQCAQQQTPCATPPNQCTQQTQCATQPNQGQTQPNYAGVNIQIFNPAVNAPGSMTAMPQPNSNINSNNYTSNPVYPGNYYTQNFAQPAQPAQPIQPAPVVQPAEPEKKKTETREIVELTDEHIKTLENYLNSQDKQERLLGAKEVTARLQEDKTRRNDDALNALVNKMLQDPYQPIRFMAMGAIESRMASGNDESVQLLQQLQSTQSSDGQDELKASNALLKMSGSTTKKEFEVENNKPKVAEKKAVETKPNKEEN